MTRSLRISSNEFQRDSNNTNAIHHLFIYPRISFYFVINTLIYRNFSCDRLNGYSEREKDETKLTIEKQRIDEYIDDLFLQVFRVGISIDGKFVFGGLKLNNKETFN